MAKLRVLIADDHAVVAKGIGELLREKFEFVGIVHDGRALLEAFERLRPDVILADISMPVLNGIEAIRQIRQKDAGARIVIMTMHGDVSTAIGAFRAGAQAYVLKISPEEEFVTAMQEAAKGRRYISPLVTDDPVGLLEQAEKAGGANQLTARQREVLQLIAEGRTMKETASILNISSRTAESHKYEIMRVLEVETTAELVQHAIRTGLAGAVP